MKLTRYLMIALVVLAMLGGCRTSSSTKDSTTNGNDTTVGNDFVVPPVDITQPPKDTVIPPQDTTIPPQDTKPPTDTSFTTTTTLAQIVADPNFTKNAGVQTCKACNNTECDTYGMASIEVVVAAVNTAGSGTNFIDFFVTDQAGNGGLMVTIAYNDLEAALGTDGPLAEGDKLQITGELQEYFCMTRLRINPKVGGFLAKVGTGAAPAPKAITSCNDLTNEANEGALVKLTAAITVKGLEPIPPDTTKNRGEIQIAVDGVVCLGFVNGNRYDLWGQAGDAQKPPLNATFKSITGVISYSFGAFQLLPRKPADLDESGSPTDTVAPPDASDTVTTNDADTTTTDDADTTVTDDADTTTTTDAVDDTTTDDASDATTSDAVSSCNIIAGDPTVWINEFHYSGANPENTEFIELAGPAALDVSNWSVVLYNGTASLRKVYMTIPLNSPPTDVTVSAATFPNTTNNFGFITISFTNDASQIQNGDPDAIAVVDDTGKVVQFLAYKTGTFEAVDGPAVGCTPVQISKGETDTTPQDQSVQLTGSGSKYSDFTWSDPQTNTKGAANTGQTFQ